MRLKILRVNGTVAVLPIGQYSLLADSHSWSKSLKFGIDINKRSKILFYQLAKDFEVILTVGRRGCCFFMKCQIIGILYIWRRRNKNNKFFSDYVLFFAKYSIGLITLDFWKWTTVAVPLDQFEWKFVKMFLKNTSLNVWKEKSIADSWKELPKIL